MWTIKHNDKNAPLLLPLRSRSVVEQSNTIAFTWRACYITLNYVCANEWVSECVCYSLVLCRKTIHITRRSQYIVSPWQNFHFVKPNSEPIFALCVCTICQHRKHTHTHTAEHVQWRFRCHEFNIFYVRAVRATNNNDFASTICNRFAGRVEALRSGHMVVSDKLCALFKSHW